MGKEVVKRGSPDVPGLPLLHPPSSARAPADSGSTGLGPPPAAGEALPQPGAFRLARGETDGEQKSRAQHARQELRV